MKKIFDAKKDFPKINKDGNNPFFNSKYATLGNILEKIEPVLIKNDLHIVNIIRDNAVVTKIMDNETELIESTFTLPVINDPQKLGSAITYGRRYNLVCIFNLNIEDDDDGNSAKPEIKKPEVKKPEPISKECQHYIDLIAKAKSKSELENIGTAIAGDPDLTANDRNHLREIYKQKESKGK